MKKLFVLATCAMLFISFTVPVKASTAEEVLSGQSLDDVFEDMKNSMINGEDVSFATSLEKVGGLTISTEPQFDLSDTTLDMDNLDASLTNLGFSSLSASLAGSYNNIDLSGKAEGCVSLFNNTFEGLSADKMLATSKQAISSTYSDAINTEEFQTVKDTICIGEIFAKANEGASAYDLASVDSLKGLAGASERNPLLEYQDTIEQFSKDQDEEFEAYKEQFATMSQLLTKQETAQDLFEEVKIELGKDEDEDENNNNSPSLSPFANDEGQAKLDLIDYAAENSDSLALDFLSWTSHRLDYLLSGEMLNDALH